MRIPRQARNGLMAVAAWMLVAAPSIGAPQFTPDGVDDLLHIFDPTVGPSGPGTPYSTGAGGVDYDQIGSAEAHPGEAHVTGNVTAINYSDGGTASSVNFGATPLDFTLMAQLIGVAISGAPTSANLALTFAGVAGWDLVVTDPQDGNSVQLRADLVAGTFAPIGDFAALQVNGNGVNATLPGGTLSSIAFFEIDPTTPYAPLFDGDLLGLQLGQVLSFHTDDASDPPGEFNVIAGSLVDGDTTSLVSHRAVASGSIFRIASSAFTPVPEPGTLVLVCTGLLGLASAGRRRSSK